MLSKQFERKFKEDRKSLREQHERTTDELRDRIGHMESELKAVKVSAAPSQRSSFMGNFFEASAVEPLGCTVEIVVFMNFARIDVWHVRYRMIVS